MQSFTLEEADYSPFEDVKNPEKELIKAILPLKNVKFQRVSCLTLFLEANMQQKPTSVLYRVGLYGQHTKKIVKVEEVL